MCKGQKSKSGIVLFIHFLELMLPNLLAVAKESKTKGYISGVMNAKLQAKWICITKMEDRMIWDGTYKKKQPMVRPLQHWKDGHLKKYFSNLVIIKGGEICFKEGKDSNNLVAREEFNLGLVFWLQGITALC